MTAEWLRVEEGGAACGNLCTAGTPTAPTLCDTRRGRTVNNLLSPISNFSLLQKTRHGPAGRDCLRRWLRLLCGRRLHRLRFRGQGAGFQFVCCPSTPLCQYSLTSIHLTTTHGGNWVGLLINRKHLSPKQPAFPSSRIFFTPLSSLQQSRSLIAFLSQTYEEALEAQKAKKEAKKPSKAKNSEANKKKKWKKSNKGDLADKNDAVSPKIL